MDPDTEALRHSLVLLSLLSTVPCRSYKARFANSSSPVQFTIYSPVSRRLLTNLQIYCSVLESTGNCQFLNLLKVSCEEDRVAVITEIGTMSVRENADLCTANGLKCDERFLVKELTLCAAALFAIHSCGLRHGNLSVDTVFVTSNGVRISPPDFASAPSCDYISDFKQLCTCFLVLALGETGTEEHLPAVAKMPILSSLIEQLQRPCYIPTVLADYSNLQFTSSDDDAQTTFGVASERHFGESQTLLPSFSLPSTCMQCYHERTVSTSHSDLLESYEAPVLLPCDPDRHFFCSRRCFRDYIREVTNDFVVDLSFARCKVCLKCIDLEYTLEVLGGREEAEREIKQGMVEVSKCCYCRRINLNVAKTSCGHDYCAACVSMLQNSQFRELCKVCGNPLQFDTDETAGWMQKLVKRVGSIRKSLFSH